MDIMGQHTNGMAHIESEFVRHTPCINCGSSDANSLYSDGHAYCFVCHTRTPANGEVKHTHQMKSDVQIRGSAQRLQRRGISEKTNQLYKIFRDGELLRFHYFTSDGILQGAKVKTKQSIGTITFIIKILLFSFYLCSLKYSVAREIMEA